MAITFDSSLADRVVAFYADRDQLTEEECSARLPRISADNRGPLCEFMGPLNDDGIIDAEEGGYLEGCGIPRAFIELVAGTDSKRPLDARMAALMPQVPGLVEALQHGNNATKVSAARELGQIGSIAKDAAVPALTLSLDDDDALLREAAAEALGCFGTAAKSAAGKLCDLTRDAEWPVRHDAILALGRVGDNSEAVKRALRFWIDDKDETLRLLAEDALRKLEALPVSTCAKPEDVYNP